MNRNDLFSGSRFRSAVGAFLLGRAAQGVANLLLTLWVVRLLGVADYGAYMALWGLLEMLVPLSSLGLLEAVRRFLPALATRGNADAIRGFVRWTTLIRWAIIVAWIALIASTWDRVSGWMGLNASQAEQIWPVLVLILAVLAFRYACEMLECLLEQRWSQLAHALHPIGRLLGVAWIFFDGEVTLARLLWVDVILSVTCFLLAEWALLRKLRSLNGAGDLRVSAREVFDFSWHLAGVNILSSLASLGAQRLLVARLLGLELAGLFSFIQQILIIVSRYMPAQLLANVIRPMLISRLELGEKDVVSNGIALMWKSNLLIVLGCVAVLLVGGDVIIGLVSGGRFNDAGLAALILFVGLGASSQNLLINMAMQIHHRSLALRNLSFLSLLVPLLAWAGARQGLVTMAIGIVLALWIRNAVAHMWLKRHGIQIDLDAQGVLRMSIAAAIAAGVGLAAASYFSPWMGTLVTLVLLGMGLLLAGPLNPADQELLTRTLKSKARHLQPLVWRK